jgi:hypothetical protein
MKKLLLSFLCLGALCGFVLSSSSDDIQGVTFSHSSHIIDAGVDDCGACHEGVFESTESADDLIPGKESCAGCHDVDDEESCNMCHENLDEAGTFERMEPTVAFDHSRHLGMENVECLACHGELEDDEYLVLGQEVMVTCSECHDGAVAERECGSCHLATDDLRPASHDPTFGRGHGELVKLEGESTCRMCHEQHGCADCHGSGGLVRAPDEYAVRSPYSSTSELSEENRVLERVHDDNYRYTHPLDAKSGVSDCVACHSYEQFCSECHLNEAEGRTYKPASHDDPDWGFPTYAHAEQARRDLGSCVSCHEGPGRNQNCLGCHPG